MLMGRSVGMNSKSIDLPKHLRSSRCAYEHVSALVFYCRNVIAIAHNNATPYLSIVNNANIIFSDIIFPNIGIIFHRRCPEVFNNPVFDECRPYLSTDGYEEKCRYDFCALDEMRDILLADCGVAAAYVLQCKVVGRFSLEEIDRYDLIHKVSSLMRRNFF